MELPPASDTVRAYSVDTEQVPKRRLEFTSSVRALAPFLEAYAFFTVAPLYLWGRFDERILVDFLSSCRGGPVDLLHYRFEQPVFHGLRAPNGDPAWNHVLWAIERPRYQAFEDHLVSCVVTDTPRQTVYRYAVQDLEITDPLFVDRTVVWPERIPTVRITAFGVACNRYQAAFEHPSHLVQPPQLLFYPPDKEGKLYAQALYTHEDPALVAHFQEILDRFAKGQPQWKSSSTLSLE